MRGRAVVNEEDEYGNTPLHLAAWNSSKKAPPRGQQTIGAALTRIDGADSGGCASADRGLLADASLSDSDAGLFDWDAGLSDSDAGLSDSDAGLSDSDAGLSDSETRRRRRHRQVFAWLMEHGADKVPAHPPPALPRLCGVPRRRVGGLHAWVGLGAEMLRPARSLPPPLSEGPDPPQPQALQALTEWHAPLPPAVAAGCGQPRRPHAPLPHCPVSPPPFPLSCPAPRPSNFQLSVSRPRCVFAYPLLSAASESRALPTTQALPRADLSEPHPLVSSLRPRPAGRRMNGPARRSTWAAGLPSVGMVDSAGPEPRPGRPGNGAPTVWLRASYAPAHRVTCSSESRRQNHGDGVTATQSRRRARWSGRGSEHVSRPSRPTRPWLPAFKPQSPAHLPARPAPPAGPAPPAITIQSGAGRPQATGCRPRKGARS